MRGIQIVSVLSSGVSAESDEIVRDLENWFEDHQTMCRLMTTSLPQDARDVASNLDRLKASIDSGQRMLVRLKNSFQNGHQSQFHRSSGSIPLSGMNRFEENCSSAPKGHIPVAAVPSGRPGPGQSGNGLASGSNLVMMNSTINTGEPPRMLPSRTYLKKSGNGT